MDVYFISILIIGAVIFIKVMVIVCIYACRAKRLRQAQRVARQDSSAYPSDPHTQRSAIINFEETPQPIISVPPGTDPTTLNPMMAPPPYSVITQGKEDKPPTYEEIMQDGEPPPSGVNYGEPATTSLPIDAAQQGRAGGEFSGNRIELQYPAPANPSSAQETVSQVNTAHTSTSGVCQPVPSDMGVIGAGAAGVTIGNP